MRKRAVIIGGGTLGLTAAIGGAGSRAHATVVGHMDQVGKKILSAGSGRCNLINLRMETDCYRYGRKEFPMEAIRGLGVDETLASPRGLGIELKNRNGHIHPNSDQAPAVLDVLRSEVEWLGMAVLLPYRVEKIKLTAGGGHVCYKVYTDQSILDADAVTLAAGPKAAPFAGLDGSGYELAGKLRHRAIRPLLTLMQPRYQGNLYRQMTGIRTEAGVKLMAAGKLLARDRGEL